MIEETRPWEPQQHPTHEASPEALKVLLAMADWKGAITHAELVALTALDGRAVSYALRGLKERARVEVEGTGPRAAWKLAHRAKATP